MKTRDNLSRAHELQQKPTLDSLTEENYRDIEIVITRVPHDQVGSAIKRLRERAKLTQDQLAHRFRRHGSAVACWETNRRSPPRGMTVAILEMLGIPKEIIQQHITTEIDADLDARAYASGDATEIEYKFFERTRGKVLHAIYTRALEGDSPSAKLYREWMDANVKEYSARQGAPKLIGNGKTADWTRTALEAAIPREEPEAPAATQPDAPLGVRDTDSGVTE